MTGAIGLPDGAEMIMPGDNVEMKVELITPIAIEIGQRFATVSYTHLTLPTIYSV